MNLKVCPQNISRKIFQITERTWQTTIMVEDFSLPLSDLTGQISNSLVGYKTSEYRNYQP